MLRSFNGKVYLACGPTDLCKSIDGLAIIISKSFKLDPFSNALFIFCNRNKDKIKILHWEYSGFWLYYKRLEKGIFKWPDTKSNVSLCVSSRELTWLLDGLSVHQKEAHKEVMERLLML